MTASSSNTTLATTQQLGSGQMFDRIAARYDRLNKIMSMGLDRLWRRRLVRAVGPLTDGDRVLDVASGTADVALAIANYWPGTTLTGLDPSAGMLDVGRQKVRDRGLSERIELVVGDAQDMPFADDTFAASCISFGIRNVPDRLQGLREMARVTRPGGVVAVLELSEPREGLLSPLARFHVHHVVPRLGAWLSGEQEYRYLQESIAAFPPPQKFAALMKSAGLEVERIDVQTLATAHLYVARKVG
ncbi:MAG: bifunctional demethylmenaquinone methyltransferase/2-methoxy-6-polyprenyl-1,4-benzoquinol methylase UbiE [Myxococcales bacterium]|nr:bifunctional demethylmenaquinone methyltransferase/2-methoxy-6-polyprenyl-1,4-benzoquinol methylase UbiE [Myxococcales bacterium]